MNQHRLLFELDRVAMRFRLLRFCHYLAAAWLAAAVIGLVAWGLKVGLASPLSAAVPFLCVFAAALTIAGTVFAALSARDNRWVARQIEGAFPELRTCL